MTMLLRRFVLAALCGFVVSACGGDDAPGGVDAGVPSDMPTAPPDGNGPDDLGSDGGEADDGADDAGADVDAGGVDAGPMGDDASAGDDAGAPGAGVDAGSDAGVDAGPPPVRDVDILFMVDNSGSMGEEQASLAAELPRLVQVLASGDRAGDGPTPDDFAPVRDLHVGVVTSDMGVGGFTVPTCSTRADFGDDGILRTQGNRFDSRCLETYPGFLSYVPGTSPETPEDFGVQFGCLATPGTTGCGFEQQLEATLKALTPASSSVRFRADTTGHGDGANAGFLRPDSLLVVVLLTDEEDCSVRPGFEDLFNPMSTTFEGDLNLRCFLYKAPQHPVSRYVDGLRALRPGRPDLLIVAAIAGVPVDLIRAGTPDYTRILADPRMVETLDTRFGFGRVTPSCEVPGRGFAYPPRRMVEVAQGFGANGVVQSICQGTYDGAFDAVIARIAVSM